MDNEIRLLDVVQMKKKHPCGGFEWTVIRLGADIKIRCNTCSRLVMLDRETFIKRRKKTIKQGPREQGETVERLEDFTSVVAALIWQKSKFLICQRPANKDRALLWEFVGGKVEKGEGQQVALIRECKEELGINIKVEQLFDIVEHKYDNINIVLYVYNAKILSGNIQNKEHNDIKWIHPNEIDNYEFCPADKDVLAKIKQKFA